jgi:outer membrane immunogenic protein
LALLTLAGAPALAAPPPPPAPVYGWTGWYVGGNVGYGWGDPRTDAAANGTGPTFNFGFGVFPFPFGFTDSNAAGLKGAIGGGQIGYNYQIARKWVLGFEADFQGSAQRGGNSFVDQISEAFCFAAAVFTCLATTPFSSTALTGYEAKIGWFGTVRGRVGFLLTDQIMLYGTGGLAYGRVEVSGSSTVAGNSVFGPGFGTFANAPAGGPFSAAATNVGYTVGAGAEGKLFPGLPANWSWKLEYLYLDLGSLNSAAAFGGTVLGLIFGQNLPFSGTVAMQTRFTDNIVRVGLNYQFH